MGEAKASSKIIHISMGGLILAGAVTGCSRGSVGPADYSLIGDGAGTYFLTQPVASTEVMDALYQGMVLKDEAGCLRLREPDAATVVWPFGFTLDVRGSQEWVVDAAGRDGGVIGGTFRFGGGEVPFLHKGLGFTPAAIAQIHAKCPGRFWIVGEVS